MEKNEYHVIGVMSGTSLDGIDLVQARFTYHGHWHFEILNAETVDYNEDWRNTLGHLLSYEPEVLKEIDEDYTKYLAGVINQFIKTYNIKNIDMVCSHGHTALHQPENNVTYQIGNLPALSKLLNKKVICDFRKQDVELGGQGAPLVPVGDKLLFSEYDYCVNLGGFANISMDVNDVRVAYDICPVNIVLNHYVKQLGLNFDDKGQIASTGVIHTDMLNALNDLDFYRAKYPKSLGLEWVKNHVLPLIDTYKLEVSDILRTFIEHMAIQIASEIKEKINALVLITGGGVYNTFLIEQLKRHSNQTIVIPSNEVIEFKEALIFGFLGVLKLRNEANCLQSVTGALKNHSSGTIFLP
ncbi:anhydro-N-acetylmuramic acid kinase [Tamlana sp. 2201CG12-4]|uniref:anhydro-N-acetylmuramic acid kinase n=1 Tax=Tamlana sp. 2201CG12-4 TaxID=3112582 RepID=UPI002DBB4B79|nr:anhydro-N-acetylmuramic acid kinase [Tamlana sp. 2201CG12-4]MEC3906829.1 anhydro-N-acetylmuramic acid kinase [Tamlana sp. 2201CG12-4]